ncbi:hypothetical protein B0H67DRAFT_649139 [Lasiosphaeris hirsuta]|uniref:Uncharacterized protein n=1 Tax=Lasiosphaeris hirsuta TaxID=260670 RepID=A0AA40DL29_9PEZI|nr:hypothetical protein B0H67DRAFT_649139 [Lasiosphaeris hirsuta]
MRSRFLTLPFLCWSQKALANVEKTIFLGPTPIPIPSANPSLDALHLDDLSPTASSRKVQLESQFPTDTHPLGISTWLLLKDLEEGRRYEVRICWAATQPTSFTLRTHELDAVLETPDLITSLWAYSTPRAEKSGKPSRKPDPPKAAEDELASTLFLEILAAADYFTANATLMRHPPLVNAELILDPFLFNIIPRSLLPTIGLIAIVAIVSYILARWITSQLRGIIAASVGGDTQHKKRTTKKKQ